MLRNFFLVILTVLVIAACSSTSTRENAGRTTSATQNQTASNYNVQLGLGYLQQGDVQRSKQKLLSAIQQDPNSAPAQGAMGYFAETTGNTAAAENYYRKAVELNPTAGAAQNNYGTYLCRQGHYQEAEQHFLLAVQDPTYLKTAEVYENAGLCAMQIPDNAKAMTYFTKAVTQDPSRAESWLELGQINFQQKNFAQAQQDLTHYMQLTPEPSAEALWLGIRLAREQKDTTTAGRYTLTLQIKYPNSEEYRQLMASPNTPDPKAKKQIYF